MKKALWIGIFSLLALAPLQSGSAQTLPAARVGEKASSTVDLSNVASPSTTADLSTPAKASEKQNPAISQSNSVPKAVLSSNSKTSTAPASVSRSNNGETAPGSAVTDALPLTDIYRVGVGDVLDIRLLNSTGNRSTLYSVIEGGLIDYPIAGGPISVGGLTTKEIQARIFSELKRVAMEEKAPVAVGVRQYGSHSVIITGLVGSPGTKFLRREAVPLYVLLAEVQPRLDAARATIMRAGSAHHIVDLSDSAALNFTVSSGDVINLTSRPQEFYYIGGRISYPGQKAFQPGITLFQAILAAGGLAKDNAIELSREVSGGRLLTTRFDVKQIKSGKVKDPRLAPGDRIEVLH